MRNFAGLIYFIFGISLGLTLLMMVWGKAKMQHVFLGWLPSEQIKKNLVQMPLMSDLDCPFDFISLEELKKNIPASELDFSKSKPHQSPKIYFLTQKEEQMSFYIQIGDEKNELIFLQIQEKTCGKSPD